MIVSVERWRGGAGLVRGRLRLVGTTGWFRLGALAGDARIRMHELAVLGARSVSNQEQVREARDLADGEKQGE